ncbi:hypothetical protein MACK_001519 [Theileria orientalis]|uniref:LCCL domain-containing protein n=1 Tax=Theileria orientalis TaxID=68886 RepID=A0A976MCL4_THEOR|nr:hypothetical protein MACK_001519 [Theileria orientalis]
MNVNFIINALIFISVKLVVCRNANEFYTFRDAKATSVFIAANNDFEKHGANRAFQIGSSYWSSEGQHNDTDFVSWTGELYEKALISQINIFWEYAPKEVEISFSLTGDDFNVVMPFRATFENKRSYKENFKLDVPYETKYVRLTLRGAINTYFGIRHIHVVGYGHPMFMLKSGISSKDGEMCLQLEEGNTDNQPRVVLDLCVNAIAAADGRELWIQNSRQQIVSAVTYPPKCLTTVESSKHGPVILDDCTDDSCTWEFVGNAQISLKNGNNLCLTQQDDNSNVAGMGNLVDKYGSELKVVSSGSSDGHEEKFAVDQDKKTYWASLLFPDDGQHVATMTIDFGKVVHASRVVIDWEYQPLSYSIEASSDNITFKQIAANLSNASHTTTDAFPGTDFLQLRVVMMRPHYLHGVVSGGYVYGIRDLSVLSNNLITVVGDCRAAANSADARDKYFVSYVSAFEPIMSRKITSMENNLHAVIADVSDEMNRLKESLEESASCMDEKQDYEHHIDSIVKKELSLWKTFTTCKCGMEDVLQSDLSTLGENRNNPAEDCYFISQKGRSGFYWIQPPCSKQPLRVYCDMDSQSSIFIWNGVNSASIANGLSNSAQFQCASYGLEPFVIKSKHQIDEIKKAIHIMGFDKKLESYIPLAYRFGSDNKFRDFMNIFSFISLPLPGNSSLSASGSTNNTTTSSVNARVIGTGTDTNTVKGNITRDTNPNDNGSNGSTTRQNDTAVDNGAVLNNNSGATTTTPDSVVGIDDNINNDELEDLHMNAMGLSMATSELEKFDMETSEISAIVCSTNKTDEIATPVELNCGDVFGKSKKLYGSLNTNILVRCVEDCSEKTDLFVYGKDGLYSDRSAICPAAIHSGVIASKGTFVISVESGMKYYEGSKQNGIQSLYYNKSWHGLKDIIKEDPMKEKGSEQSDQSLEHNGPDCKYSIRILPLEKRCPIVETQGSFLQISTPTNTVASSSTTITTNNNSVDGNAKTRLEGDTSNNNSVNTISSGTIVNIDSKFDPNTMKYANKVIDTMDSLYGVDNKTVTNVIEQIAVVVSQAKKRLKSLEPIHNKQNESITSLFDRGGLLESGVENVYDSLDSKRTLYANLLEDENSKNVDVASDFVLDYGTMHFSKTFSVYDSAMTSGKSNWGYSNTPLDGRKAYVVQSGDSDSELVGEGSYAFINHFKYFDFDSSFDVMASGAGSMGIAFRAHDKFNFYLFRMNFADSNKQLIKVEDGVAQVLLTNPDEGYEKDKWYNVRIICEYYYISVYCNNQRIFRVIDTSFLYGYFGLFSSGSNSSFHFDNVIIKNKEVKHVESPLRMQRLSHIKCCNYSETFTGSVHDNYLIVNPQYSTKTSWSYENLFNGEHKVIHQVKPSFDPLDIGSLAILKNDRYCKTGFLRFRVLPQCEAGTVGAALHYRDEKNMFLVEINVQEFRIRQVKDGDVKVLAKENAKLAISKWNVIEIEIGENYIKAKAKVDVGHNYILKGFLSSFDYSVTASVSFDNGHYAESNPVKHYGSDNEGSARTAGRVMGNGIGLKSLACDSCYFDNVHISSEKPKEINTNFISVSSSWKPCLTVNLIQRKKFCNLVSKDKKAECLSHFCAHCCNHHTRLLGDQETLNCINSCSKNNLVFNSNVKRFNVYLGSCTSFQGPGFDHCKGDKSCLIQSCKLCCHSGHYNQFDKDRFLESAYCENKCKIPF